MDTLSLWAYNETQLAQWNILKHMSENIFSEIADLITVPAANRSWKQRPESLVSIPPLPSFLSAPLSARTFRKDSIKTKVNQNLMTESR
jgi:hypothetical protein